MLTAVADRADRCFFWPTNCWYIVYSSYVGCHSCSQMQRPFGLHSNTKNVLIFRDVVVVAESTVVAQISCVRYFAEVFFLFVARRVFFIDKIRCEFLGLLRHQAIYHTINSYCNNYCSRAISPTNI